MNITAHACIVHSVDTTDYLTLKYVVFSNCIAFFSDGDNLYCLLLYYTFLRIPVRAQRKCYEISEGK